MLQQSASEGFVYKFSLNRSGSFTPVILNLPESAGGAMAVDGQGQLHVAASGSQGLEIDTFAAGAQGNASPVSTLVLPSSLSSIYSLTFDADGKLYILSQNSVYVFPAGASGSTAPIRTITDPNIGEPSQIAADSAGNIYINTSVDYAGGILIYAAGSNGNATGTRTLTSTGGLGGVAVDSQGDIYSVISEKFGEGTITLVEFAAGASGAATPTKSITVSGLSGYNGFAGLSLDSAGNIYAIDNKAPSITSQTVPHLLAFSANAQTSSSPSIDITSVVWTSSGASVGLD